MEMATLMDETFSRLEWAGSGDEAVVPEMQAGLDLAF